MIAIQYDAMFVTSNYNSVTQYVTENVLTPNGKAATVLWAYHDEN